MSLKKVLINVNFEVELYLEVEVWEDLESIHLNKRSCSIESWRIFKRVVGQIIDL